MPRNYHSSYQKSHPNPNPPATCRTNGVLKCAVLHTREQGAALLANQQHQEGGGGKEGVCAERRQIRTYQKPRRRSPQKRLGVSSLQVTATAAATWCKQPVCFNGAQMSLQNPYITDDFADGRAKRHAKSTGQTKENHGSTRRARACTHNAPQRSKGRQNILEGNVKALVFREARGGKTYFRGTLRRQCSWPGLIFCDRPKSETFTRFLLPRRQLRAAKSMCTNRFDATNAIPLAICAPWKQVFTQSLRVSE